MTAFFDILIPKRCVLCEQDLGAGLLCACCLSLCNFVPFKGSLKKDEPVALFYYELALRELIKDAKFSHRLASAYALRELFQSALTQQGLLKALRDFAPSAISYIPTHWLRRSLRGLDLPSLFAASLAKELGCPLKHCLRKRKFSDQQSKLSKKSERQERAKGIFELKRNFSSCERLLLVDDIVTTGATLKEASRLLAAGCKEIRMLTLAKTP